MLMSMLLSSLQETSLVSLNHWQFIPFVLNVFAPFKKKVNQMKKTHIVEEHNVNYFFSRDGKKFDRVSLEETQGK